MSGRIRKECPHDDFLAGICVALQCVTAFDSGVLWEEIVNAVGKDEIINYALNIEPDEWGLAGFAKYVGIELEISAIEVRPHEEST